MIPDPHERTVKIPAQWKQGKWQLVTGGELPELKDGAVVDLVMPAIFLADPEDVERWTEETTHPFLHAGTELFVRVNANKVPATLLDKTVEKRHGTGTPSRFVRVVLEGDLTITIVPGKKGKLNDCPCSIPVLDQKAESVNEAYKKIAIVFEPSRRSNSGNIFLLAFIQRAHRLVKLDKVRDEVLTFGTGLDEQRPQEELLKATLTEKNTERCNDDGRKLTTSEREPGRGQQGPFNKSAAE